MQKIYLILCLAALLTACQQEEENSSDQSEAAIETFLPQEGLTETVLGQRLENPYSVKNMRAAFDSLFQKNARSSFDGELIATTHYYLKFFVAKAEDYDMLLADSLELFEYPLDYEIESYGDYYAEGSDDQQGQWFYTVVPKAYKFGAIDYEILEDLFMEDAYENSSERTAQNFKDFYYQLEDESLRLAGMLPDVSSDDDISQRMPPSRNPSGTLLVRNTATNTLVPVVGVKVKTRRLVKIGHGYTDTNGNYTINKSYRYDVHYMVSFANQSGFKVWNTLIDNDAAEFNGPKQNRNGWSYNFETNSHGWRFATVSNATRRYFDHATFFGVGQPHSNLRIAALNRTGASSAPMLRRVWGLYGLTTNSSIGNFFLKANGLSVSLNLLALVTKLVQPDLVISASPNRGTAAIYAVTFHELAHASHQTQVGSSYWVKYINYIITYGSYGNGTGQNAGHCGIGEMWGNYFSAVCMNREIPNVSGVAFYLIAGQFWFNPGFLLDVDNINDVTTAEIFSSLGSSTTTFPLLINQLKLKTTNDAAIDNAFANYTDWP